MDRFQVIWTWHWHYVFQWPWIGFIRMKRAETGLALIYRWVFWIGPLEVRRWTDAVQG